MKHLFAWRGLKSSVQQFVQSCLVCQQAKLDRARTQGSFNRSQSPKEHGNLFLWILLKDFLTLGLQTADLLLSTSSLSIATLCPFISRFRLQQWPKPYMEHMYMLHKMPMIIIYFISDSDRIFTSAFLQELFKMSDTDFRMSSIYHPHTDGQTDRVNKCLQTFVRCYVHAFPKQWSKWLFLVEFCAPFRSSSSTELQQWLSERSDMVRSACSATNEEPS